MPWQKIAEQPDIMPGEFRSLEIGDDPIALFNVDGQLYAIENRCPHRGAPLIGGPMDGCILTCGWHGWQFDISNGQARANPMIKVKTYPIKIEAGEIFVEI